MKKTGNIITVGLSPSWDMRCQINDIDWGQHKVIDKVDLRPAGKALNISKALAWMNQSNIAAGLWGKPDYTQALDALASFEKHISFKFTLAPQRTRQNINIVDTANHREMHLRAVSELATKQTLAKLQTDLRKLVTSDSLCAFAGAMPGKKLIADVIKIIHCRKAKIVLDSSGPALRTIVSAGGLWLIKPNIEELSALVGNDLDDNPSRLIKAALPLLDKTQIVLISRGTNGAIVLTEKGAWQANFRGKKTKVLSTVGCGDFLLAGFLKGFTDTRDIASALKTAIIAATAKAFGICERKTWLQAKRQIKVEIKKL